jgi:NAD(P)-dependent dehydrogenase (short-subunit alcohol dehydrogenase family)
MRPRFITISSTAGTASTGDFLTAYAASKFGVEGCLEGLASEITAFGIKIMLVEPSFFRIELLTPSSTRYHAVHRRPRRPHHRDHRSLTGHERQAGRRLVKGRWGRSVVARTARRGG